MPELPIVPDESLPEDVVALTYAKGPGRVVTWRCECGLEVSWYENAAGLMHVTDGKSGGSKPQAFVCLDCGSLVVNQETHDDWHKASRSFGERDG